MAARGRRAAPDQVGSQPLPAVQHHRNRRTPSWRHYAWWDLKLLRPFDLVVDDLACFRERLGRRRQRRRAGEPQAVLVVDRHDEPRLPRQVEGGGSDKFRT